MREPVVTGELMHAPRNPHTAHAHRREVWWQILLPLLLGIALGGIGLYALFSGRFGNVQNAAELATVLLIAPFVIIAVLLFVVTVVLIYVIGRAMHWIPTQTVHAQRLAEQVSSGVVKGANALAGPLLFVDSWATSLSRLFRKRA